MASIYTAIHLTDNFTNIVNNIVAATDVMISTLESADNAMSGSFDAASLSAAKNYINQAAAATTQLKSEFDQVGNQIQDNVGIQNRFNGAIKNGTGLAGNLVKGLMGISVVQRAINTVENQFDSAINRMDTMNNFDRTMTAITKSSAAAEASLESLKEQTDGTAYGLDVAAKATQNFTTRGMAIGSATAEVGKWADAVSFYGDGTNETLASVTDALGKMMSKGTVEMEQLNRLTDAGINGAAIYAQAVGRSVSSVQDDLSNGKISSMDFITTVSSAFEEGTNGVLNISGAAKKAGETWSTSIANMKAAVTRGIISMIENIDAGMERAGFGTILENIRNLGKSAENALGKIGTLIGNIIALSGPLVQFIREHNDEIQNAVEIVISLAAAYTLVSGAVGLVTTALTICQTVMEIFGAVGAAVFGIGMIVSIAAAAVAIYSLINWVQDLNNKTGDMGETMELVFKKIEVILAQLETRFTIMKFSFETLFNVLRLVIEIIARSIAGCVAGIVYMVLDSIRLCINTAIGYINTLIQGINMIPGVDINTIGYVKWEGINSIGDFAKEQENAIHNSTLEVNKKFWAGIENIRNKDKAAKKAQSEYDELYKKYTTNNDDGGGETDPLAGISQPVYDTAANTAKIAKAMDVTTEQLKYIRDIAEQKYINRFTTASITINQTNHNTVNNDMDLDGVTEHLRSTMEEQMAAAAEGVH